MSTSLPFPPQGACEVGFARATTDKAKAVAASEAAVGAAPGGACVYLEVQQGVDRAADLGWLSFYPWEEAELVLPALSYLELLGQKVDGERLGVRVAHRAPNFALP